MDRLTKESVVAELHDKLKGAGMAVLAGYSGMNVAQISDLRNQLRQRNGELKVVKNNLLRIASEETDFGPLHDYLVGPLALVMSYGDPAETTKALVDFAKKNEKLDLKVGVLSGRVFSKEQLKAFSELPSREILLGNLLSVLTGVHRQFVCVLAGVPRQFVQVLNAYREKKEQEN